MNEKKVQTKGKKRILNMKICVVGDPAAGKTFLIRHLTGSDQQLAPTEQYEISLYQLETKYALMQIQLWDCSGNHSKFHKHLRHAFFRNSSATLLIFDISQPNWQQQAHNWISEAYENQCYLVYAIATRLSPLAITESVFNDKKELQKNLMARGIELLKVEAQVFFKKYEIGIHFLQESEDIQKHFEELFTRLHEQAQIVSRNSLARGMQLPFDLQEPAPKEEDEPKDR